MAGEKVYNERDDRTTMFPFLSLMTYNIELTRNFKLYRDATLKSHLCIA